MVKRKLLTQFKKNPSCKELEFSFQAKRIARKTPRPTSPNKYLKVITMRPMRIKQQRNRNHTVLRRLTWEWRPVISSSRSPWKGSILSWISSEVPTGLALRPSLQKQNNQQWKQWDGHKINISLHNNNVKGFEYFDL